MGFVVYLAAGPELGRRLPGTRRYQFVCAGAEPSRSDVGRWRLARRIL